MIKGVNRQVIEVTDTGNCYFERALLIVRASCTECDTAQLHEEARRLVAAAGGYAGLRRSRRRAVRRSILIACLGAAVGLLLGLLLALVI